MPALAVALLLAVLGATIGSAGAASGPHEVHIYHPVDGTVVPWNDIDMLFWSVPSGAAFSCNLDGVALTSCRSMTAIRIPDGPHTLVVSGLFADGVTSSATSHFTVDGPKLAITSPKANTSIWPNAVDVATAMTLSSAPGVWLQYGLPDFTYTCRLDAAAATPCTFPFHYGDLSEGGHTVQVVATDQYSGKTVSASRTFWIVKPKIYYPSNGTVVPTNQVAFLLQRAGTELSCTLAVDGGTPTRCLNMSTRTLRNGTHGAVMTVTYAGSAPVIDTSVFTVQG